MLKTSEIEVIMLEYLLSKLKHNIAVPRCEAVGFEADVLSVTSTAFLHEFEIKISKQDFLKENKKKKWIWYEEKQKHCPNYFWYVCEKDLISPEEVKDFAGLIYIDKGKVNIIKSPARLHSAKCNVKLYRKIIRSLSFKLLNESKKLVEKKKKK
jgi:hypothetical protein